jgi:anti-sigma-K factor RskA
MSFEHDDDFLATAAAWVLGALPDDEAQTFAAHLRECPACREEVARLQSVADVLPLAAPAAAPPPGLKARIMDVVEREAELLAAAGPDADRPARRDRRRGGFWAGIVSRPWLAGTAVAATLAVGVLAGVLVSDGQGPNQTTRAATFVAAAGGAHATLVQRGDEAQLRVADLAAPKAGRVYQVWVLRGAKPEPDAVFTVDREGRGDVVLQHDPRGAKAVLVTEEPAGGSTAPTSPPSMSVTPA